MEKFDKGIWNRLNFDGECIAAELIATSEDCRRWVAVYKAKKNHPLSPWREKEYLFSILDFELKTDLLDEYFSEEDKQNQKRFYFDSEVDLLNLLQEQKIDLALFAYPWKCDYPL